MIVIPVGWWLVPLIITLGSTTYAWVVTSDDRKPRGDYSIAGIGTFIAMLIACVVSLVAWLIWALVA